MQDVRIELVRDNFRGTGFRGCARLRNAAIYAENRDRALDDVLADEQRVYAELLPLLEALTTEDLTDPAHFDRMIPGVPPWRIFAGNTFLHYEEHACAVREWLRASGQGD